jgi:AraC family transcriptional activator of tynA and feaB
MFYRSDALDEVPKRIQPESHPSSSESMKRADFSVECSSEAPRAAKRDFEQHFPNIAVEASSRDPPFLRADGFSVATTKLYSTTSSCLAQRRQPPQPDRITELFGLLIPLTGVYEITEPGRRCSVVPGSLTLIDGSTDFAVASERVSTSITLLIPRAVVLGRYPNLKRYSARAFDPEEPGLALMREILLGAFRHLSQLDELQRSALASTIVDSFGLPKISCSEAEWRVQKAICHISDHLGDVHLDAHSVARAQFISRRSLDEHFCRVVGRPVTGEIMERRLNRAAEFLADPLQAGQSIGLIAYNLGFEHPAHFTRAFKRRFGVVPRAWRLDRLG